MSDGITVDNRSGENHPDNVLKALREQNSQLWRELKELRDWKDTHSDPRPAYSCRIGGCQRRPDQDGECWICPDCTQILIDTLERLSKGMAHGPRTWYPKIAKDALDKFFKRCLISEVEDPKLMKYLGLAYTYEHVLDAWIAGRANLRKYGEEDGDKPDFLSWLKETLQKEEDLGSLIPSSVTRKEYESLLDENKRLQETLNRKGALRQQSLFRLTQMKEGENPDADQGSSQEDS